MTCEFKNIYIRRAIKTHILLHYQLGDYRTENPVNKGLNPTQRFYKEKHLLVLAEKFKNVSVQV